MAWVARGGSPPALVGALVALPLLAACAGPLVASDGGFRHREQGWRIAAPEPVEPPWRRVSIAGALLAYRRPDGTFMSFQSRCDKPRAAPQIMARHLLIGLPPRTLEASGPVVVGVRPGWTQTVDVEDGSRRLRVKTVTVVGDRCTFDWILSSRGGFEAAEPSFDAWWSSFELDAAAEPAGGA